MFFLLYVVMLHKFPGTFISCRLWSMYMYMIAGRYTILLTPTYTTHIHVIITSSSFKYIYKLAQSGCWLVQLFRFQAAEEKKTNTISACEWHAPEHGNRNWLEFRPPAPPLQASCARATCCLLPRFHLLTSFFKNP